MQVEDLIEKVCTFSCTKEDLVLDYSSIKNLERKDSKCSFIREGRYPSGILRS